MLKTVAEVSELIRQNQAFLHISGAEELLRQLPKGYWIGGSIEYFLDEMGGVTSNQKLFVHSMPFDPITVAIYDETTIKNIAVDAYDNGFSVIIVPFGSEVGKAYARYSPTYEDMYMKPIIGWGAGFIWGQPRLPVVVDGQTGEFYTDKAVVMHVKLPHERIASISTINMFEPNKNGPVIEFLEDATRVGTCLIDGVEVSLNEYLKEHKMDSRLPIIGEYFNANINTTIFAVHEDEGVTEFASVVYKDLQYRFANPIEDYETALRNALSDHEDIKPAFACNCVLHYLYGGLEGKNIGHIYGANVFGEIAYQLMNQTLVYLTIE